MQFDWGTLALQTVNFAILVWLLYRFLYRPVLRMVDKRRAEIQSLKDDARAAQEKAQLALADVEAKRSGIADERKAVLRAAAEDAEKAAETSREAVRREAAQIMEGAQKSIASDRRKAAADIRRAALDLGLDVARRLLAEMPAESRAEGWLERIEAYLADLSPDARAELAGPSTGAWTLRVVTAAALPPPVRTEWKKRLGQALGDGANFDFDTDESLIAGAELHFPNAILRFSWRDALSSIRDDIGKPRSDD